jgi:Acetoacetate decarboxylase (ADC)
MAVPKRVEQTSGRYALVDGIPFSLPVAAQGSPALMAAFSIDYEAAKSLLPEGEIHPLRLWRKGVLMITVIDYRQTVIGKYIEFSIAIACTHGLQPATRLLPMIFRRSYGTGQFVIDLPVSTEISVKGGKGIWGMPKHQASLNFEIQEKTVSSRYDLDRQMAIEIEIERPERMHGPMSFGVASYAAFRGLLMKSDLYFKGKLGFSMGKNAKGLLKVGDHPRVEQLKSLKIEPAPLFTAFLPSASGILDDHFECWFLNYAQPPDQIPEGMESVVNLGLSEDWPQPPG